jgi:HK97 gp10 family phage protein
MSDDIFTFKITGLDELQKNLEALPKALKDKIIRKALNAGADIVLDEMERNCPVEDTPGAIPPPGFLKDHIKKSVSAKGSGVSGHAVIGPTDDTYPVENKKE